MPLDDVQKARIEAFRAHIEEAVLREHGWDAPQRHDRQDGSTLATRYPVREHVWIEYAVRPFLPQVRVGLLTDDRWLSEEFEQRIEDSGDTMTEFVGLAFETAGLDWSDPPVEHYREGGTHFYFATPLDLQRLEELDEPAVRDKVRRMLAGYREAFL